MLAAGVQVTEMRVCGGPARSAFWNAVKADVTGFPVAVPDVLETAVLGSAILGAVGIGAYPDLPAAIGAMTRIAERIEPRRELAALYDRLYEAYVGALPGDRAAPAAARRGCGMTATARRTPPAARPACGAIELRDLSFAFRRRDGAPLPVLDGIDLDDPGRRDRRAHRPERLRQVDAPAGHRRPAPRRPAGTARLDGAPIAGPDPRIGLVFQEPRLLPWRSAADNITYPLELAGWPAERRDARLAALIDLVGLDPAVARRPPVRAVGRDRASASRSPGRSRSSRRSCSSTSRSARSTR